jgi:hypothetical protein
VEIGRKRCYIGKVASQFNGPSTVSYLCSVNTARPALVVSSYSRNPTESGNRRQMATPSISNLTIRCVDLNFLLSKQSSSSTYHLPVTRAFTNRENGPEAGISGRWRHLAEVTGSFDRLTPDLLLVFCRHFSSSWHRFRVIRDFRSRGKTPEAETAARWRRVAEVT